MLYRLSIKVSILVIAIFCSSDSLARVYHIFNNDIPFEQQLSSILTEIEETPGTAPMTIQVEGGYYNISETIVIVCGRHKIELIGSKKTPTIISGSIVIKGWEELPNGLWRAHMPYEVKKDNMPDQLYVNGIRAKRSRTPNEGVFLLENGVRDKYYFGAVLNQNDFNKLGEVSEKDIPVLSIFWKWTVSKRHLINMSISDRTLYYSGRDIPTKKDNGIIIENTREGVDIPGEWCVDSDGYIYYMPKPEEKLKGMEFRIPVLDKLMRIYSNNVDDSSGLCVRNFVFEHTSYLVPTDGSSYRQAAAEMSAAIEVDNIKNFSFEVCEIRNIANYGIWFRQSCSDSSIENNNFHDLGAGAIKIGALSLDKYDSTSVTNHITVNNNVVSRYGELMESAVGIILFHASDCKITHNDIHHGSYSGISLGWVWGYGYSPSQNNEVAYNRISHIGNGLLCDLGGIYTLGRSEGTHIHHNVISEVKATNQEGWGVYLDEGTTGVSVENNIVWRCSSSFLQHYGSENIVNNNILAFGDSSQIQLSKVKEIKPLTISHNIIIMETGLLITGDAAEDNRFVMNNNCYWKVSTGQAKIADIDVHSWIDNREKSSIFMDPLFKNPRRGNFKFRSDKVCQIIGFRMFDISKSGVKSKRLLSLLRKSDLFNLCR